MIYNNNANEQDKLNKLPKLSKLSKLEDFLKSRNIKYGLLVEDSLSSFEIEHRGLAYHVWEFEDDDGTRGAESNVKSVDKMEDYTGEDFVEQIIDAIRKWR